MVESQPFPEKYLNRIYDEKLFKLFLPESVGGLELSLPEGLTKIKSLAEENSDLGWVVALGAGGGYFYPYMTNQVRETVFKDAHSVIAGSGSVGGHALPVDKGYNVNGRWRFCTGSLYATTFTANCEILDGSGKPTGKVKSFIFPKKAVRVTENWNGFGLTLTESHTIEVKDTVIPVEHTFDINEPPIGDALPIHTFPFRGLAESSFAMVCKGIWNKCVESAEETIAANEDEWDKGRPDKVRANIRMADDRIRSLSHDFKEVIGSSWDKHCAGQELDDNDNERIRRLSVSLSSDASRFAHEVFSLLGMKVVMHDHPFNIAYRDLLTASQHSLLKWSIED